MATIWQTLFLVASPLGESRSRIWRAVIARRRSGDATPGRQLRQPQLAKRLPGRLQSASSAQGCPASPAYAVNYWHQHAIRTVIRHLSIAWVTAQVPEAVTPLRVQHQVLLTTLGLLLNREARQPMPVRRRRQTGHVAFIDYRTGIRLAQPQGIRAGPLSADPERP